MTKLTTKPDSMQSATEMAVDLFDNWFDPIETEGRARAREFIEELIRGELDTVLARPRYGRSQMACNEGRAGIAGHRHGRRTRSLTGTFGPVEIAVPREGSAHDQEHGRGEQRGLAHGSRQSHQARPAAARVPPCRWCTG